jgi:hypothetical protein
MEKKICSKCNIEKEVCEYNKKSVSRNGTQYFKSQCKTCQSEDEKIKRLKNPEYYKIWYDKNRKERNEYRSKYYKINKEKIKDNNKLYIDKHRIYRKKKYNEDILFKLRHKLSSRLRSLLNFKSYKKNKSINEVIGCSPEFLKHYLEEKFTDSMTWENHGFYGWHIDHIIPLSSAKSEDEIYKLCHYTNLQPLWAKDNLIKGNKIIF